MGHMTVVHELSNDYSVIMFVVNNPEKRHQIFVFIFRTTDLPSHDSFSICRENLVRNRETARFFSRP